MPKKRNVLPKSEELFDREYDGSLIRVTAKEVEHYRSKLTYAGAALEAAFYPVWNTEGKRKAKQAKTREAVRKINQRNTRKKFLNYLNANFTKNDLDMTLTYAGTAPSMSQVKKDLANYIRRLRRYSGKYYKAPFKYIYYIHGDHLSPMGQLLRVHIHLIVNAMDRDDAEGMWVHGTANSRRLRPDNYESGLNPLGNYLLRRIADESGDTDEYGNPRPQMRRWGYSQNLKKPEVVYPRHKLSRRRAANIARDADQARRIIEKEFPGYRLLDLRIFYSTYVGGVYMYADLRRRE